MRPTDDAALLEQYAHTGADSTFAAVVERHIGLVYSAAHRQVRDAQLAEDVAQAVFIVLARKAGEVARHPSLSGWLLLTTRYAANAQIRAAVRRTKREQEAVMHSEATANAPTSEAWAQLEPYLDEAMASLGTTDRAVVAMRYFENKTAAEIGTALRLNEEAAKKRANRALEKLRRFFEKKGVWVSAGLIAAAISANSVSAAPMGIVARISSAVNVPKLAAAATGGSTLALVKSTLNTLAWAQYKFFLGLSAAAALTGGVLLTHEMWNPPREQVQSRGTAVSLPVPLPAPVPVVREVITDTAFISLDSPPGGLSLQPDGKIIVGASLFGRFIDPQTGSLGCYERGTIRLNGDGTLDRTFSCRAAFGASDSSRAHIDYLPDGKIMFSGLFDSVDGKPRPGYARLLANGQVDETFVPTSAPDAPALSRAYLPGGTYPAAALRDGSVAVTTQTPLTVYRLDPSGKLTTEAPSVSPLFPPHMGLVYTLKNEGFWGNWLGHKSIDWDSSTPAKRRPAVRPLGQLPFEDCQEQPSAVDAAEVLKAVFAEVPIELCRVATPLPDGGVILGVQEAFINGSLVAPGNLMRFDKEWRRDSSFTNSYEFDRRGCMTLRRLKNGKILAAGGFVKMNGVDFPGLVRLTETGEIDPEFRCQVEGNNYGRSVMDVAVQEDGKIIICGAFTKVNGVPLQHLARLNPDGSLDTTFKNPFISLQELQTHRRFPVYHLATHSGSPSATNATAPTAPAAVLSSETIQIDLIQYQSGVATIWFTGASNTRYVLQAKDSLTDPEWTNISTNQPGASTQKFSDTSVKEHPMRFYRVVIP